MRNYPEFAGRLASAKHVFGERSRYAVAPVFTRSANIEWFVWDAEVMDDFGFPSVIRQEPTREAAMAGLTDTEVSLT